MAVLWAATSIAFRHADHPPIKTGEHPPWDPSLFALDLLLPVIDLGQVASGNCAAAGSGWPRW